jgi:hypothetical protein
LSDQNLPADDAAFATSLSRLPLFAQTLVASRVARRAALAMLAGVDLQSALLACDTIDKISGRGNRTTCDPSALAAHLNVPESSGNETALSALHHAVEAIAAALHAAAGQDAVRGTGQNTGLGSAATLDAAVTHAAGQCIGAVCADPRISKTQFMIVLSSDIEQIAFVCGEAKIGKYDGAGDDVLNRLAPCHAFDLFEPPKSIEDQYR